MWKNNKWNSLIIWNNPVGIFNPKNGEKKRKCEQQARKMW